MNEQDQLYHKIRQLFAMAEHAASNEHEAAIALEKAQALLLQHNLDRATLGVVDTGPSRAPGIGKVDVTEEHGWPWRRSLAHVIAINNLCKVIGNNSTKTFHLFGTRENVRSVLEMYYWIAEQLIRLAGTGHREYKRQGGYESARTWNNGFYQGAINTLGSRLERPMEEFRQGAGQALVHVHTTALSDAVRKVYPHTSKSSRRSVRMGDGYFSGKAAGNRVTLGKAASLSSGRAALKGG